MSKTRKRLRKAIMGAAALYGASKLKGSWMQSHARKRNC